MHFRVPLFLAAVLAMHARHPCSAGSVTSLPDADDDESVSTTVAAIRRGSDDDDVLPRVSLAGVPVEVKTLPPPPRHDDRNAPADGRTRPELTASVNVAVGGEAGNAPPEATTVGGRRWVQKVQYASRSRSLGPPRPSKNSAASVTPAASSVWFGRVIADVLYGAPWPTSMTSPKCAEDVQSYNRHLRNFTLWAIKMLDSTSKGPEGLLEGNTFSFGNFEECINTKSKHLGISGGYSLVDIDFRPSYNVYPRFYDGDHSRDYEQPDEDKSSWEAMRHNIQADYVQRHKYQWAVCLPDTCEPDDVQKIVSNALIPELNHHGIEANITIDPSLHTSNQNLYKYSAGFYFIGALYAGISGLIIAGTMYDFIYLKYQPKSEHGPMKKFMKPFSLISNLERLLKPSESNEFSIIHGLKVLSIVQVILGHRWFIEFGSPQMNTMYSYWMVHCIWLGHFKSTVFLETFFVISGFLTFHLITKHLCEKKRLNFIPIMIYRWLRIFPVYGTLLVTYIFVLPYLNDGPYWRKIIYRESSRCQDNWWTNLFFINNYVNTDEQCIIPAWYLACDMHFFIVGTIITYLIWKWRKLGLTILGMCLSLSIIYPAYVIIRDEYWGTVNVTPQNLEDLSRDRFFTDIYIKSHMRSMTYLMGLLAGYVYMRLKEADYQLSLKSRIIWSTVCFLVAHLIYFSCGTFFILGHEYVAYEHAVYFTVARFIWSLIIAYGIIGHALSGLGVFVSDFFGHRVFQVLGKLVFCTYMYQEIIQLQTIAAIKTPTYQSLILMTWKFCGDTLMGIMYAFAINVMIESPFDRLQKNFMKLFIDDAFSKKNPQQVNDKNHKIENKTEHIMA